MSEKSSRDVLPLVVFEVHCADSADRATQPVVGNDSMFVVRDSCRGRAQLPNSGSGHRGAPSSTRTMPGWCVRAVGEFIADPLIEVGRQYRDLATAATGATGGWRSSFAQQISDGSYGEAVLIELGTVAGAVPMAGAALKGLGWAAPAAGPMVDAYAARTGMVLNAVPKSIGNVGRTSTANYLSRFSPTELDALRTAGLSDVEIARHVELSGDVHLFRGTSPGWVGSLGAQATAVSATTDPSIATVFALEARGQAGQAVVQFGPRSSIGTFDLGNWMAAQEREVGVLMSSKDFAARAPSFVPVDTARQVLGELGMPKLPYTVASPSARSMLLDAVPKMTPEQVAEFIQRINKTGLR
ncbi:hypothetical protein [Burkholderia sp. IMCC1007]|uniref:hypothetical protein n=1 Tax=Burkholderia sp. IMCC1007 TaxID=3004104 RepID=UPI0022B2B94B|nr:hypothetical protein [Burkholderia sp. IMCC1007]